MSEFLALWKATASEQQRIQITKALSGLRSRLRIRNRHKHVLRNAEAHLSEVIKSGLRRGKTPEEVEDKSGQIINEIVEGYERQYNDNQQPTTVADAVTVN